MARKQLRLKKEPFLVTAITLTLATADTLAALSGDTTDISGRRVSGSAVIRALLRYAKRQGYPWARQELAPLIEKEQATGFRWGKTPVS